MYIPKSFRNTNLQQLHRFIDDYGFATFISYYHNELQISHIPLMLSRKQGKYGTLVGHLAKSNPQVKLLDGQTPALCIFNGPHAYISPAWYKSHPNVPTWNYSVVHAYGNPVIVNQEQLSTDLTWMLKTHESRLKNDPQNQNLQYDLPYPYKHKLMEHIVGFKMEILKIEGAYKLGQNRSMEDQIGILEGLRNQNTSESLTLAHFIESMPKTTVQSTAVKEEDLD